MNISLSGLLARKPSAKKGEKALTILIGAAHPSKEVLTYLDTQSELVVREAFTPKGVMQNMSGANLVILGDLIQMEGSSEEIMRQTLEHSGIPVVHHDDFIRNPQEWIGRAHLTQSKEIPYLPPRQANLLTWAGGVGKTTLAMAVARTFAERTRLPAALLELSLGGSALQARISTELPEFYAIATGKAEPAAWHGVSVYPMDGRSIDVLWHDDRQRVLDLITSIQSRHTLFVVDCHPAHPLYPPLTEARAGLFNFVVTSPRDDAVLQARRMFEEVPEPRHLVWNMSRHIADRAESGVSALLPYNENYATSQDPRLADPILSIVYPGWDKRK